MRRHIAALAVTGALALGACSSATAAPSIELVSAPEAQELLAAPPTGLVVLDVRTPEEYAAGHITGSDNIDFYAPDFLDRLDALDKDAPYFVYCRSGNRSATTIEAMRDLGFTEVYELGGGVVTWAEAGYPLEQ
jgi:rhodanese-related sulfurtransferase